MMVMAERARQLAERHEEAMQRAAAHSEAWHRKQAKRRFFHPITASGLFYLSETTRLKIQAPDVTSFGQKREFRFPPDHHARNCRQPGEWRCTPGSAMIRSPIVLLPRQVI